MGSVVQRRSYGSVKVVWLDRLEAVRRVREAGRNLVMAHPEVIGVYLFGSLAEGRAVPGSDADILILLERSERRWIDRPLEFYPYFENAGIGVDLFCYTIEEADRTPLARRALEGGVLLAGRSPVNQP